MHIDNKNIKGKEIGKRLSNNFKPTWDRKHEALVYSSFLWVADILVSVYVCLFSTICWSFFLKG